MVAYQFMGMLQIQVVEVVVVVAVGFISTFLKLNTFVMKIERS